MGSLIDRRLSVLEESFGDELRALDPDEGELAKKLFLATFRTLSVVEMGVWEEVAEIYGRHPGLSPADVWHKLTIVQRDMQYQWLRKTRYAAQHLQDNGVLPTGRSTSSLVLLVGNYPFFMRGKE